MTIPNELVRNFAEPKCKRELMQKYGELNTMFGGSNENGERVHVSIATDRIITCTFQDNGWLRQNEYDEQGYLVGETFLGRWREAGFPAPPAAESTIAAPEVPAHLPTLPFCISEGDIVYIEPTGNGSRLWNGIPYEAVVTSVKRKYFYVQVKRGHTMDSQKLPVCLKTFDYQDKDCNTGYKVYRDMDEFQQEKQRQIDIRRIRVAFSRLDLDSKIDSKTAAAICKLLSDTDLLD